jgi:hypothetical protein
LTVNLYRVEFSKPSLELVCSSSLVACALPPSLLVSKLKEEQKRKRVQKHLAKTNMIEEEETRAGNGGRKGQTDSRNSATRRGVED